MQVGVENLAGAEEVEFLGEGFFDFYDHVAGVKYFFCGVFDVCPGGDVLVICEAGVFACCFLDEYLMAA